MSRKRYIINKEFDGIIRVVLAFVVIGIGGWIYQNKDKAQFYLNLVLGVVLVLLVLAVVLLFFLKKRRGQKEKVFLDETRLLNSFKGESPNDFEKDVADIFSGLGYKTGVVGGTHDGAVDVKAVKDGDLYLIQCKRWTQAKAGVQDVRQLHSAVHRDNAKKGFFIALSGFTLEAEAELGNDSMMELIDGDGLIKLYKLARNNKK